MFKYVAVYEISVSLGPSKSLALPFFYDFLGCDTISAFFGKGKLPACNLWQTMSEVTNAFRLRSGPSHSLEMVERCLFGLEKLAVRLYGFIQSQIYQNWIEATTMYKHMCRV